MISPAPTVVSSGRGANCKHAGRAKRSSWAVRTCRETCVCRVVVVVGREEEVVALPFLSLFVNLYGTKFK